jgi:hypothetical protein
MKYKVTITNQDSTGFEDVQVHEDVTNEGVLNFFNSSQSKQPHKTVLIEPMPEKQKVTVWFYVIVDGKDSWSVSKLHIDSIEIARKKHISNGLKVSEIKSMEVEI